MEVKRKTPLLNRLVDYTDGSILTEKDLDLADTQFLFLIQEAVDELADAMIYDHLKDAWDAGGKRLTNLGEAVEDTDAVTYAMLKRLIKEAVGSGGGSGGSGGNGGGSGGIGGGIPDIPDIPDLPDLPTIEIDLDKIKAEIIADITKRMDLMQRTIEGNIATAIDRINEGMERLKKHNSDMFKWAGIDIDEKNGTAVIKALEDLKTQVGYMFSDVLLKLDANAAALGAKASRVEVDALGKRISTAELNLDAAKATINLKAEKTDVNTLRSRLDSAGIAISALQGQVAMKAEQAVFSALEDRIKAAEVAISLATGNIVSEIFDFRELRWDLTALADGVIANAASNAASNDQRRVDIAKARLELYAKLEDINLSVAKYRLELFASIGNNKTYFDEKINLLATDASAMLSKHTTLATEVGANRAAMESALDLLTTDLKAEANQRTILETKVNDNRSVIENKLDLVSTDAKSALNKYEILGTQVGNNKAAMESTVNALSTKVSAEIGKRETLEAKVDGNKAAIESTVNVLSTKVNAEASKREILEAKVDGNKSAIQTEAETRAKKDGELGAKYGVRLDVNGYVTGFVANNDGKQGDFVLAADKFKIVKPNGTSGSPVFTYDSGTGTLTLNQIKVNNSNISDGAITTPNLGNNAMSDLFHFDTGKIYYTWDLEATPPWDWKLIGDQIGYKVTLNTTRAVKILVIANLNVIYKPPCSVGFRLNAYRAGHESYPFWENDLFNVSSTSVGAYGQSIPVTFAMTSEGGDFLYFKPYWRAYGFDQRTSLVQLASLSLSFLIFKA